MLHSINMHARICERNMWTSVRLAEGKSFEHSDSCLLYDAHRQLAISALRCPYLLLLFHSRVPFSCGALHSNGHGLSW